MATDVKRRRSYDGKGGQARTRLTRAAVIQAARALFLERGYAATTIEAISDLSEVPPATVYRLFSSKLGILKALFDVSIAGDDEAVALPDRPLVSAAGSDPDAAALLAELTRQRQQGHAQIARSLARAGALRPKLRERDADDIIDALTSPEVYRTLVCDRGWPPERYEQWLKDILIDQLLAPPATGGRRTDSQPFPQGIPAGDPVAQLQQLEEHRQRRHPPGARDGLASRSTLPK